MENGPGLKMYFLFKMGMFHCYVTLPERIFFFVPFIYIVSYCFL